MNSSNETERDGTLTSLSIEQLAQQLRSFEAVIARFDRLDSDPMELGVNMATPQPDKEDERIAHQTAVQLLTYESDLAWSRFNALLVANGLVISAIGLFSTGRDLLPMLILPGFGVVLCILLGIVINRGLDFHSYWEASACQLEESLAEKARVVTGSFLFRRGQARPNSLPYNIAGQLVSPKLSWKRVRSRYVANAVVVLFVILYVVLFLFILFGRTH